MLFILKFFFSWLGEIPEIITGVVFILLFIDVAILYRLDKGIEAQRITSKRLSNGDENPIQIELKNKYGFAKSSGN